MTLDRTLLRCLTPAILSAALLLSACAKPAEVKPEPEPAKPTTQPAAKPAPKPVWEPAVPMYPYKTAKGDSLLFDGESLQNWRLLREIFFDDPGKAYAKNKQLFLTKGNQLTGVGWTGPKLPTSNYEVTLEAQRVDGGDFFLGLTFPIGKEHASLILGGWGGQLCGVSSINGFDASENETTGSIEFKNKKWYKVRLRVTEFKLEAWVDKEQLVDVDREGKKFEVRVEMETARPFGLATYATTGAFRNVRIRKLKP